MSHKSAWGQSEKKLLQTAILSSTMVMLDATGKITNLMTSAHMILEQEVIIETGPTFQQSSGPS